MDKNTLLNISKNMQDFTFVLAHKNYNKIGNPEYVGFITNYYRKLIDGKPINKLDEKKLKLLFNRDFTEGYLFHNEGKNIMNIKTSNHQGIEIGTIIETNKKYLKIKLTEDLNQEDGIRFENNKGMIINKLYNNKMLLTSCVKANEIAYIENKCNIKDKGNIRKTTDIKL